MLAAVLLACYSPLYIFWYHAWDSLKLDLVFIYYANWKALIFLLMVGVYALVRALGGFRIAALTFAFLTLTSGIADVWPYPVHMATFILAIGVAAAARLRSWPSSLAVIAVCLLTASFVRPEYMTSLLLFCPIALICAGWVAFKRPELRRPAAVVGLPGRHAGRCRFHAGRQPAGREYVPFWLSASGIRYNRWAWQNRSRSVDKFRRRFAEQTLAGRQ